MAVLSLSAVEQEQLVFARQGVKRFRVIQDGLSVVRHHRPVKIQKDPTSPGDLNADFRASESFLRRTDLGSRPCCRPAVRNRRTEMAELILPFGRPSAGRAVRSIAGMATKAFADVR